MNEYKLNLNYEINKKVIECLYEKKGFTEYFENDNTYLENSFDKIKNLWLENFDKIEKVKYIMIAEAPLWGIDEKYIYNPKTNNSQFFYRSDLENILNIKIENKSQFINICNSLGLIILDISPFPLNPKDTKVNYRTIGRTHYKEIVGATLSYYFEEKVNLVKTKISKDVKVFFRYSRVKKNFEDIIGKVLVEKEIINSLNEIGDISQKGGGVNRLKLKEIIL